MCYQAGPWRALQRQVGVAGALVAGLQVVVMVWRAQLKMRVALVWMLPSEEVKGDQLPLLPALCG
jgi:hypothetical protein